MLPLINAFYTQLTSPYGTMVGPQHLPVKRMWSPRQSTVNECTAVLGLWTSSSDHQQVSGTLTPCMLTQHAWSRCMLQVYSKQVNIVDLLTVDLEHAGLHYYCKYYMGDFTSAICSIRTVNSAKFYEALVTQSLTSLFQISDTLCWVPHKNWGQSTKNMTGVIQQHHCDIYSQLCGHHWCISEITAVETKKVKAYVTSSTSQNG